MMQHLKQILERNSLTKHSVPKRSFWTNAKQQSTDSPSPKQPSSFFQYGKEMVNKGAHGESSSATLVDSTSILFRTALLAQHSPPSQSKVESYLRQHQHAHSAIQAQGIPVSTNPNATSPNPMHTLSSDGETSAVARRVARALLTAEERAKLRREELRRYRLKQASIFCRKFLTFLLSHIGLSILVISYVVAGGFLFQHLEKSFEEEKKDQMRRHRNDTIHHLLNILLTRNVTQEIARTKVDNVLVNYTSQLVDFIQNHGWNGKFSNDDLSWSSEGSFLYAVTVITTIGYGHAAPRTDWGRVATMIYAILGIPLTFLFLSNTGDHMVIVFKIVYSEMCLRLTGRVPTKRRRDGAQRRDRSVPSNWFRSQFRTFKGKLFPRSLTRGHQTVIGNEFAQNSLQGDTDSFTHRKFYCRMSYLPGREKEKRYQQYVEHINAMKKSQSTTSGIPVLNWRDIDSELEVVSLKNPSLSGWNCEGRGLRSIGSTSGYRRYLDDPFWRTSLSTLHPVNLATEETSYNSDKSSSSSICQFITSEPSSPSTITRLSACDKGERKRHGQAISISNDDRLVSHENIQNIFDVIKMKSAPSDIESQDKHSPQEAPEQHVDGFYQLRHALSVESSLFGMPEEKQRQVSYLSEGWSNSDADSLFTWERNQRNAVKLEDVTVPISLSLLVLVAYVMLGALVFIIWEDKDFLKWSYFCFITLSTIGFGDILPGTKIDSENPKEKLIILSLYVTFGLALVAMCFKLMQEEVLAKLKRLGKRIEKLRKSRRKPT